MLLDYSNIFVTFKIHSCINLLYGQSKQESPVKVNKLKILTIV